MPCAISWRYWEDLSRSSSSALLMCETSMSTEGISPPIRTQKGPPLEPRSLTFLYVLERRLTKLFWILLPSSLDSTILLFWVIRTFSSIWLTGWQKQKNSFPSGTRRSRHTPFHHSFWLRTRKKLSSGLPLLFSPCSSYLSGYSFMPGEGHVGNSFFSHDE